MKRVQVQQNKGENALLQTWEGYYKQRVHGETESLKFSDFSLTELWQFPIG